MIDLTKASELKFDGKVIEKIEDINGLIIYEAWKNLIANGVPPLKLLNCKGVDLVDYKIYGESVQKSILPDEYEQIEYIETDGNQYIDTGVIPSNYNDGIKYVFSGNFIDYSPDSYNNYLFGSLNNGLRSGNVCFNTSNNLYVFLGGTGSQHLIGKVPDKNTDFTLYFKGTALDTLNSEASINDVPLSRAGYDVNSAMPTTSIYLLWCNGVSGQSKPFWGKLYSFTMETADGTPIRNFVPCYRKSDNVVGLYDMVENKFYTNSGTGTFKKGDNVFVEIESVGEKTKNLFDIAILEGVVVNNTELYEINNGKVTVTGANTLAWSLMNTLTLKPNTHYCLSIENLTKLDIRTPANVKLFNQASVTTASFTTDSTGLVCFKLNSPESIYPHEIGYIQLEEGDTATEYEPYGYKIPVKTSNGTEKITTNIYLNEPLRKIGEYADYIDFENKKVVRSIEERVHNSSENWQQIGSHESKYFVITVGAYGNIKVSVGLNTHFKQETINSSNYSIGFYPINSSGYNDARIVIRPNTDTNFVLEDWKAFLDEQYSKGTPVTTYFVWTTPIEETIELPNIPTIKGTTILEVDTTIQPSNMEVVYKGKEATIIETNKIYEIEQTDVSVLETKTVEEVEY